MYKYSLAFLILFITSFVFADSKIEGNMPPFSEELLTEPINLDCGLSIVEKRGGKKLNVNKLNTMCDNVLKKFPQFIKKKGINVEFTYFDWKMSILPESSNYRCLNDLKYRFKYRQFQGDVIGYTDYNSKYSFVLNDITDSQFNITFVHELFHAMSMYSGAYESHSYNWQNRSSIDESLAQEFTEWLGYCSRKKNNC